MMVPCGPHGCVHDYVPLYFGAISPMLLSVVNAKNVNQCDILYFEFPISLVEGANAVFTDASANTAIPPNFYTDPADFDKLNWEAIDSRKWGNVDDEFRHQRMAELLIHRQLPIETASRCVVWNSRIRKKVEKIVASAEAAFPPVKFESPKRRHWFLNFPENKRSSIVLGPRSIALALEAACAEIANEGGEHPTAPFASLKKLLDSLRADFGCIAQTAELVGLKSENGRHKRTVDAHTKEVVAELLASPEYEALEERAKRLVELAAYLHDIGKGPRSRWDKKGGVQQLDLNHPVRAMPMMVDILTRQVASVTQESADILTKLVCYHDLVGDVLGNGRDELQIVEVVADEEQLDMLFALGKADATALADWEWDEEKASDLYDRCLSAVE
jgi:hypothetical protein